MSAAAIADSMDCLFQRLRRNCSWTAKSGMYKGVDEGKSHFLCFHGRAHTRRASVIAPAGADEPARGSEDLIANLVQRPAQTDTAGKVIVDEDRGMKRGGLHASIHGRAQIPVVTHQKDAGKMRQRVCKPMQSIQPLPRRKRQ